MTLEQVFEDKTIKAKAKVAMIGQWLIDQELSVEELLAFAAQQVATHKATCIEALEYATKQTTAIADLNLLVELTKALQENEPRIKWESAKVIGHIAKHFPDNLALTLKHLLVNAEHSGTVVRWATAYALGEILKLKTAHNQQLLPQLERLSATEQDNGVKKKYLDALKKVKK